MTQLERAGTPAARKKSGAFEPDSKVGLANVVVLDDWEGLWTSSRDAERLTREANLVVVREHRSASDMLTSAKNADVLILTRQRTPLTEQDLRELPRLRMVCNTGTGMSHLDLQALSERGIELRTTPGLAVHATAEHALALALAVSHRIIGLNARAQRNEDAVTPPLAGLAGRRIGICGAGRIGQLMARHAHSLGMDVSIWSPGGPRDCGVPTATWAPTLLALAQCVDVLSIHLRVPDANSDPPISAQIIHALLGGSLVVNTARAELVDEMALASRIRKQEIYVAADVYGEPLRHAVAETGGPSVLTPHVGWMSESAMKAMIHSAVTQVMMYLHKPVLSGTGSR